MPLRSKLFLSLALPAAVAIAVTMLWFSKKKRQAEVTRNTSGERRKQEDKEKDESDATTAKPDEESQIDHFLEEAGTTGLEMATEAPSSATTESLQQDSGVDMKLSSSSERKDSSAGNESASEGSVDSSSLLCFSASPTNASPPPGENGKPRKTGTQNGSGEKDVWELEFPQILCGRLIGRKGKNIRIISEHSGAKIRLIPQAPGEVSTHRIISIVGAQLQIQSALEAIHERFPCVPLTRLNQSKASDMVLAPSTTAPFVQAVLPSVANFEVVVTSVIDAGHFFIQLHNDILQRQLQELHQNMLQCYGQGASPLLLPMPQPVVVGSYCTAPAFTYDGWYRAQVLGPSTNQDEVEVKYLDYGGYGRILASSLRQLRYLRNPCGFI